uniref:HTH psq-type domain-containing protein n=1 Tax=Stomoxys calcitrans TaxID=35570 RepID=A0A1I8NU68_STOCA
MIESGHPWMAGATTSSVTADSYQYQLQSMWQKCWNTNQQNLVQQLRFRERGPLKSWRPEAMAEAIFSVLKEGLSLSQAARKYDIPYPTFVLYANRVHNMLGPSLDGGTDPRPKARGRPQRILLGMWPEDLIRSVIKAVVFRDYREIKDEMGGLPFANGQAHAAAMFGASSASSATSAANGYHSAAKLAAQSAAIGHQESASPLSSMTENLRRQIMSQQQQSPLNQSMNIYKAPAYVQRSEIEDPLTAVANKQHTAATTSSASGDRRSADNLPDLSALGLMGLPGLNVIPTGGGAGAAMFGASSASSATSAANGYHSAAKLAAQSAAIGHQESASPLSSMTENLRRQIMSQQQQSPLNQSMNIYKAPAYVQRSEIEDPLTAVANKQHTAATTSSASGDRRSADNLPDLSALGLMGLPGLNVIPTGGGA